MPKHHFQLKKSLKKIGAQCTSGCQQYQFFIKFQQEPCLSSLGSSIIFRYQILHILVQVQLLISTFSYLSLKNSSYFLQKRLQKVIFGTQDQLQSIQNCWKKGLQHVFFSIKNAISFKISRQKRHFTPFYFLIDFSKILQFTFSYRQPSLLNILRD